MPSIAFLLAVQVSAPGPENWAYVTCMTNSAAQVLQNNPSRAEFRRRLESLCPREKAVLRRLIVRRQGQAGRTPSQAESDADFFFAEIARQMLSLQPVSAR